MGLKKRVQHYQRVLKEERIKEDYMFNDSQDEEDCVEKLKEAF
jgi:hypothetical protein